MSPTKKFFSGNTLEQAVLQAGRFFEIEPEEIAYEQVERRHGFLKVRRRVVIGVDPESPRTSTPIGDPSSRRPVAEDRSDEPAVSPLDSEPAVEEAASGRLGAEPFVDSSPTSSGEIEAADRRAAEDIWESLSQDDAKEAAEEALRRIFRLGDLDLSAEVTTSDSGLEAELRGPDEDSLFEDRGRLLLALQHLLPRMVRGLTGASVPCRVDSDNFHEVRAEQLRMLAQDAAAEVRRERRARTLEPMSPDERRIVHLTLADDPAVETESHGTGLFKRVAVRPSRQSRASEHHSR